MAQRNLRLPDELEQRVRNAVRTHGYRSSSAFMRAAIVEKLSGGDQTLEETVAASFGRVMQELHRLGTAAQAQFSLVDAFARAVFLSLPVPPATVRAEAEAFARERHARLIRAAALGMKGDARTALADLVQRERRNRKGQIGP